ncbi:MAG: Ig domain-containing protein, partial [Rhodospirillaceae bacterium]
MDVVAHEVSAEIHGFSVYAVVRRLQVTTDGLPAGTQAVDYGTRTLAVAGGNGSYEWSVASGSLPTGLSLGTNGVISGTPSIAGTFDFVVRVVSGGQVAEKAFSITVHATLLLTTTSLPSG